MLEKENAVVRLFDQVRDEGRLRRFAASIIDKFINDIQIFHQRQGAFSHPIGRKTEIFNLTNLPSPFMIKSGAGKRPTPEALGGDDPENNRPESKGLATLPIPFIA